MSQYDVLAILIMVPASLVIPLGLIGDVVIERMFRRK